MWLAEAIHKKEQDRRAWITRTLPKIIGRALGLYWTWDDVSHSSSGQEGLCVLCKEGRSTMVHGEGGIELRCDSCGKLWAASTPTSDRKPSEILLGLATIFANAMHGKKPADVLSIAKKSLGPPPEDDKPDGGPNLSITRPGAVMMDSRHSSKAEFLSIIRQADEDEAARQAAEAAEVKSKADALFASISGGSS